MTTLLSAGSPAASLHLLHGETMGTTWSVKLVASPRADLHALHDGIQRQLDRVVAQMSTWEPESDLCRFNRSVAGAWQSLPAEFHAVLACALEISDESQGAYDPTIGPLVAAWGFGAAEGVQEIPPEPVLGKARAQVGWQKLRLQHDPRALLQPGNVSLDLSAIAKGYGVDLVVRHLREIKVNAALVEVGGELYGYGRKPDGSAWQVLVETAPEADDETPCVLALDDIAVATSGDRWHAFQQGGQTYSHTIDPRTGRPVEHAPSAVTVIADDAMHADAWATALTVMGATAGLEFARRKELAARFVTHDGESSVIAMTEAFQRRLIA